MKKLAIIQSSYIPWKGYFDIIHDADVFIFHDQTQMTKRDWRSRNLIKTTHGVKWLTIPLGSQITNHINQVVFPDHNWQEQHFNLLKQFYQKTSYFNQYLPFLSYFYLENTWHKLSDFNQAFIRLTCSDILNIKTPIYDSSCFHVVSRKQNLIFELMTQTSSDTYISGPKANAYLQDHEFKQRNLNLIYKDYSEYPEYPQLFPPFQHQVSILDLIFNTGPDAPYYIWGWRESK